MLLQAGVTYDPRIGLALVLSILFTCILYTLCFHKRSSYPLPPGPPGKFLVGNLGQLSNHPEQDYIRWGKEYGEYSNPNVKKKIATINQNMQLKALPFRL